MGLTRIQASMFITIFIVLACNNQCSNGLRILGLFPLNGKSHFVMCERLAKVLAERGHVIDVYSHFPLKKPFPNYTDYSLAETIPSLVNNMPYEMFKEFEGVNVEKLIRQIGNGICELMDSKVFQDLFEKLKKDQPYDLIIVELFMSNCYIAWGRYLNVPIVGVMTSTIIDWYHAPLGNPYNTAVHPSLWSHYRHPMNFWERLMNTLFYYAITAKYTYYVNEQNKYVEKFFGPGYPDASELPKDLDLLLVNTHHSIDGIRPYTPVIVPAAGLHIVDDNASLPQKVQKWLDESKDGCIYFSFGSMVLIETFPKPVLDAFYEAFRNIAPVRVIMKIAQPEKLPPGLPTNVMTQSWFSQLQVLKHKNVKAFVTHGGLMSIQETIYASVPLVGIPLFGDQYINVKSQVRRKIATMVDLDTISADSLTAAIKEILNNPEYKKNAVQFSKDFFDRPMSPADTAVYWIEYTARHGKGALRSPIIDMPWWQTNLVDVYGFILLVLAIVYYAIKLTLKKILNCCCSSSIDKRKKE